MNAHYDYYHSVSTQFALTISITQGAFGRGKVNLIESWALKYMVALFHSIYITCS